MDKRKQIAPSGRVPEFDATDGDGSLARLLSSFIATIITLIFSWRLLQELDSSDEWSSSTPRHSNKPITSGKHSNESSAKHDEAARSQTPASNNSSGNHGNVNNAAESAVGGDAACNNIVASQSALSHHALHDSTVDSTLSFPSDSQTPAPGLYTTSYLASDLEGEHVHTEHQDLDGSRCLTSGVIIPVDRDDSDESSSESSTSDSDSTIANDENSTSFRIPFDSIGSDDSLGDSGRFPSLNSSQSSPRSLFVFRSAEDDEEINSDLEYDYTGHERSYILGEIPADDSSDDSDSSDDYRRLEAIAEEDTDDLISETTSAYGDAEDIPHDTITPPDNTPQHRDDSLTADNNNNRTPVINRVPNTESPVTIDDSPATLESLPVRNINSTGSRSSQQPSTDGRRLVCENTNRDLQRVDMNLSLDNNNDLTPDTINNVVIDRQPVQSASAISRINRSSHTVVERPELIESVIEEEIIPDDLVNEIPVEEKREPLTEQLSDINKEADHINNTPISNLKTNSIDHNSTPNTIDEVFDINTANNDQILDNSEEMYNGANRVEPAMKIFGVIGSLTGTTDSHNNGTKTDTSISSVDSDVHNQHNQLDDSFKRAPVSPGIKSTEDDGYQSMADSGPPNTDSRSISINEDIPEVESEEDTMFSGAPRDLGLRGSHLTQPSTARQTADGTVNEGSLGTYSQPWHSKTRQSEPTQLQSVKLVSGAPINNNNVSVINQLPQQSSTVTKATPRSPPRTVTATATSAAIAVPAQDTNAAITLDGDSGKDVVTPLTRTVASAEATGTNPYIAVARATARAASIATAQASNSSSGESDGDLSVTVSTSCKIKNDDPMKTQQESADVMKALEPPTHQQSKPLPPSPGLRIHVQDGDAVEEQTLRGVNSRTPRRIVITIEQPPVPASRDGGVLGSPATQRRLACDLPSSDGLKTQLDVRRALSGPLTQALQDPATATLQDSLNQMGSAVAAAQLSPSAMQEIIDSVTQQIIDKYDIGNNNRVHGLGNLPDNLLGTVTSSRDQDPVMSDKRKTVNLLDRSPTRIQPSKEQYPKIPPFNHNKVKSAKQSVPSEDVRVNFRKDTRIVDQSTKDTIEDDKQPKSILKKSKPPVVRPVIPDKKEPLLQRYRDSRPEKSSKPGSVRGQFGPPVINAPLVEQYKQLRAGPTRKPKKPYESVLLQPIEDRRTPLHVLNAMDAEASERAEKTRHDSSSDDLEPLYFKPHTPIKTEIDIAFEKRQKEFKETQKVSSPISPKPNAFLVNIDLEERKKISPSSRRKSTENIKKKIQGIRLRAPSPVKVDKDWSEGRLRLSKSQENCLDSPALYRTTPFRASDTYSEYDSRKSKSLSNVGSFFNDKRSYTSLYETDLDTWQTEEIPLVQETDVDVVQQKSRSLTNLSTGLPLTTVEIDPDFERRKSLETLTTNPLSYKVDIPIESHQEPTSLSAHELRISESLKKLSVPEWYKSSDKKDQKIVELENTRKSMRAKKISNSDQSSVKRDPKPVILQHRVTVPLRSPRQTSPNPTIEPFELPSEKLKKSSVQLRTMQTRPMVADKAEQIKRKSAKEKYLELKNNIDSGIRDRNYGSASEETVSIAQPNKSQEDETYTTKANITLNKKSSVTLPTKRESRTGSDYENITASSPEWVPPVPPRTRTVMPVNNAKINPIKVTPNNTEPKNHSTAETKKLSTTEATKHSPTRKASPSQAYVSTAFISPSGRNTDNYNPNKNLKVESTMLVSNEPVYKTTLTMNGSTSHPIGNGTRLATEKKQHEDRQKQKRQSQKRADIIASQERINYQYSYPEHINQHHNITLDNSLQKKKSQPKMTNVVPPLEQPSIPKQSSLNGEQTDRTSHIQDLDAPIPSNQSLDAVLSGLLNIPPPPLELDAHQDNEVPQDTLVSRLLGTIKEAEKIKPGMEELTTPDETEPIMSHCETDVDQTGDQVVIVRCRNSKCKRATELKEARKTYKTCHNCYTYYCGRECRKQHWERHKSKCLFSRVGSACKHFIRKVHNEEILSEPISRIAKTGYLTRGRGCVIALFSSPEKTESFLSGVSDIATLERPPCYVTLEEIDKACVFRDYKEELEELCMTYNPDIKYVLCTVIIAGDRRLIPTGPGPRLQGPVIQKSAKLRLSLGYSRYPSPPPVLNAKSPQNISEDPDTLILTALPGSELAENVDARKARELCLTNIQKKLRTRGVNLRLHYPDIHDRLCAFASDNAAFKPLTIYPIDVNSGKRFTCLIMPNSEPEVDWANNPDLLEELGLATEV